ncbi:putative non-classical export protein 1 [Lyophyllum shimeji]|uniref:Non-classical export protein 1 n=1 Tax=Lyophyllum shimeji TaxID=47721 RepID=A0A9P3PFC0_LYOSH|nr:putative non-classical export protein 1 [Lyophyllum shimeji]
MALPVLLSRGLDPLLGIFTGFFAYYLHETHPRTALSPDERLSALLRWKWNKFQQSRREQLRALEDAA